MNEIRERDLKDVDNVIGNTSEAIAAIDSTEVRKLIQGRMEPVLSELRSVISEMKTSREKLAVSKGN